MLLRCSEVDSDLEDNKAIDKLAKAIVANGKEKASKATGLPFHVWVAAYQVSGLSRGSVLFLETDHMTPAVM